MKMLVLILLVMLLNLLICEEYIVGLDAINFENEILNIRDYMDNKGISFNYTTSRLIDDDSETNLILLLHTDRKINLSDLNNTALINVNYSENKPSEGNEFRRLDNNFLNPNNTKIEETIVEKYLSTKYLYWKEGVKGSNVKIGIFDSGINNTHLNCNVVEEINFTEETIEDNEGHGTFISSVICNKNSGIAPDSQVYIYKTFTKKRETYTSWLIKALDHAIENKLNIVNFSFGGINFHDKLLTSKVIVNIY
jgi:subtilisin family serine protease